MKFFLLSLTICCVFCVSTVQGCDLICVYELALKNDARISAVRFARDAVLEVKKQAVAMLLPNLSLRGNISKVRTDGDEYLVRNGDGRNYSSANTALHLQQPLINYGNIIRYRSSFEQIAMAEAEYAKEEQGLIMRVSKAYFNVLSAQDALAFAKAENKAIARQMEQVRKGIEIGLFAVTEMNEVMAVHDRSRAELVKAKNSLGKFWSSLYEIIVDQVGALSKISSSMPLNYPQPKDFESWESVAKQKSLILKSAYAEKNMAKLKIQEKKSGHYPTLDLIGTCIFENRGRYVDNDSDIGSIGLQWIMPIYSGNSVSSMTCQARLEFESAKKRLLQKQRILNRQIRDAFRDVMDSVTLVKALSVAIKSAKSKLKAIRLAVKVGSRTMVDVLNAQRELFRIQSNYSKARSDYLISVLRLKESAGILCKGDLKEINDWLKGPVNESDQ